MIESLKELARRTLSERSGRPSEGLFYLVPLPEGGWEIDSYTFEDWPEKCHQEYWVENLSWLLALRWSRKSRASEQELQVALKDLYYGLPRGRAQNLGTPGKPEWEILWSDNFPNSAAGMKKSIPGAFAIAHLAPSFVFLPHEQVWDKHKESLRKVLKLKEDWAAVSENPSDL